MKYLLLFLFFGCASVKKPEPHTVKTLSKSLLKPGHVILFGRLFDRNPRIKEESEDLVFTLDQGSEEVRPNFEGEKRFFWLQVPFRTKKIRLKAIDSAGVNYHSSKGELAETQIAPTNGVSVYLGDVVLTTDKKLKNVEFRASVSEAQKFLRAKGISHGDFVLREFDGGPGLRDILIP